MAQNSRIQGFSYYFCLMIKGSGSRSIPLTNGSGSGSWRPQNIRIWIRIRIRKTDAKSKEVYDTNRRKYTETIKFLQPYYTEREPTYVSLRTVLDELACHF
jgi:hypothetical protein